ncbi:hypothetical protein B0I18_106134 [Taibaiella chishuiensis]|uniref:Uncharacterized protein n=1 Tax=Taibaiella chishuiensis TaxID=1434707 RepID=A0A2P8D1L7_9BACT|nr:hypothetical protein B0I18_106134 [Taibaiella chishuiensis]
MLKIEYLLRLPGTQLYTKYNNIKNIVSTTVKTGFGYSRSLAKATVSGASGR